MIPTPEMLELGRVFAYLAYSVTSSIRVSFWLSFEFKKTYLDCPYYADLLSQRCDSFKFPVNAFRSFRQLPH